MSHITRPHVWGRSLLSGQRTLSTSHPAEIEDDLTKLITHWRNSVRPFADDAVWQKRLQQASLQEMELAYHLWCGQKDQVEPVLAHPPDWVTRIESILQTLPAEAPPIPYPAAIKKHPAAGFLPVIEPILRDYHQRLRDDLRVTLPARHAALDWDILGRVIWQTLPPDIVNLIARTCVLELNVARLREQLSGDTAQARFQSFIQRLRNPVHLDAFLSEYVVMTAQLCHRLDRWCANNQQLLMRLCTDYALLVEVLFEGNVPGHLTAISGTLSDYHNGRQGVCILSFSNQMRVVYKPKDMYLDQQFQHLLNHFNEQMPEPSLPVYRLIAKDEYGWSEFLPRESCATNEELQLYYERAGRLLALIYALRGTDFHCENIIPGGESPMLIDLESLLNAGEEYFRGSVTPLEPGELVIRSSVMETGFVPRLVWTGKGFAGVDLSALGTLPGQSLPHSAADWVDTQTDTMIYRTRQVTSHEVGNLPALTDTSTPINPSCFTADILRGFRMMYRQVQKNVSYLRDHFLPVLQQTPVRLFLRPTLVYSELLRQSSHPNLLRDRLRQMQFFDKLHVNVVDYPFLERVLAYEVDALEQGDIPVFFTYPGSRDLWTGSGQRLSDFLTMDAETLVRQRLAKLSDNDCKRQCAIIADSMYALHVESELQAQDTLQLARYTPQLTAEIPTADDWLMLAEQIGRDIYSRVHHTANGFTWFSVLPNDTRWHLTALNLSLYSGLSGLALFYAYLDQLRPGQGWQEIARGCLQTVLFTLREKPDAIYKTGAYEGLGGVLYTLSHLAQLWQDSDLQQIARAQITRLETAIHDDDEFDVINGVAGCILSCMAISRYDRDPRWLHLMQACTRHLLAHAESVSAGIAWKTQPNQDDYPPGFGHGSAGILLALATVASQASYPELTDSIDPALQYLESRFDTQHQIWADTRADGSGRFENFHWCHGSSGIATAYAALYQMGYVSFDVTNERLQAASRHILAHGPGNNHSLCHGDSGSLLCLQAMQSALPALNLTPVINQWATTLFHSLQTDGALSGLPLGVQTPGLMVGKAGTGFAALRQAAPQHVPDILRLEAVPDTLITTV